MGGVSFKVTDRDRGWKALGQRLKGARDTYVRVGVLPGRRRDGADAATVAAAHEFGAPDIGLPERSFLRRSFDAKLRDLDAQLRRAVGALFDGKGDARGILVDAGEQLAQAARDFILSGRVSPPDKPETLREKAKKGALKTLVTTGQLVRSIAVRVDLQRDGGRR